MKLSEAIAVFDKSAERTTPNKQTEAWAVIRAELVALDAAPVGFVVGQSGPDIFSASTGAIVQMDNPASVKGKRVRLVPTHSAGGE